MVEGYEYGGERSLISLGQMLGEILQEIDFVGDLGIRRAWSASMLGESSEGVRTITLVLISAVMTESLLIRSLGDRFGSR